MMIVTQQDILSFHEDKTDVSVEVTVDHLVEMQQKSSNIDSTTTDNVTDDKHQTPNQRITKKVQFNSIMIQEYPIVVGCNPSVSRGVPIEIDWYPISNVTLPIQEYETMRQQDRVFKREMLMKSSDYRYRLLRRLGFTARHLHRAELVAIAIRNQRMESYHEYQRGVDDDGDDNTSSNQDDDSDSDHNITDDKEEYYSVLESIQDNDESQRRHKRSIIYTTLMKKIVFCRRRRRS